jgi:hypothetical protein
MKFKIEFMITADLEISPEVFEQIDEDWKNTFYNLETPEEIAEHISYNMLRGCNLSNLDGFANLSNNFAKLTNIDYEPESVEKIN